jgi:uncharacterized membrane protein (DUF485 family)
MPVEPTGSLTEGPPPGTWLGVVLTLLLMAAYFGFIGLGALAPAVLARPLVAGGTVTVAFAYGLFVIALGVVLTSLYVWVTRSHGD